MLKSHCLKYCDGDCLSHATMFPLVCAETQSKGRIQRFRREILLGQLLVLSQFRGVCEESFQNFDSLWEMCHWAHMVFIDKWLLLEEERGEIGPIQLPDLVELQVEFLGFDPDFLVGHSVQHVRQKVLEGSLVTLGSQLLKSPHCAQISLTCLKAEHDDLLDLILHNFDNSA